MGNKLTLEQAKVVAAKVLGNLIHYPRQKRGFYTDDVTTVAIALVEAQSQVENKGEDEE